MQSQTVKIWDVVVCPPKCHILNSNKDPAQKEIKLFLVKVTVKLCKNKFKNKHILLKQHSITKKKIKVIF